MFGPLGWSNGTAADFICKLSFKNKTQRQCHLTLGFFLVQYHFALHLPFKQELQVIMASLAYQRQKLSIVNANSHIVCDPSDDYQYQRSSYPGHTVYRDLTDQEIQIDLPKALTKYRNFYRSVRVKGIESALVHLTSEFSHRTLTNLLKSIRSDLLGKKICDQCKTISTSSVSRKCVSCSGTVIAISEEVIFENFLAEVKRLGHEIDVRYFPGTGYDSMDNPDEGQKVVPGDPDLLPPTTRENIAVLMNTAGNR